MSSAPYSQQQHGFRGPPNKLHAAIAAGSTERAATILREGSIDIDQGMPAGDTPLMMSVGVNCSRITRMLLHKGANTTIENDEGATALYIAAEEGHLPIAKMLIKAGAPVESVTTDGFTPLHASARRGHWGVVTALIEAGANPDSRLPGGETPLFYAVAEGHMAAMKVLLRAQANATLLATDARGASFVALEMAVHNGHSSVVGELVQQRGIEACGGPSGGVEALRLAALAQRLDIVEVLSNAGVVDTGIVLLVAAGRGYLAITRFLLKQHQKEGRFAPSRSAYVNSACGRYGAPPLLHAIGFSGCCSPKIARLLVDAGAATSSDIRVTNKDGFVAFNGTPLAFTDMYLRNKKIGGGRNATEEQLKGLETIHRLLLRVEAAHADDAWLWPSTAPRVAYTAESSTRTPTPMTMMLPNLRWRASARRRVVMSAVVRSAALKVPSIRRGSVGAVQWDGIGWLRVVAFVGLCIFVVYLQVLL